MYQTYVDLPDNVMKKPIVNFHHYEHNIRRGDFKHMIPLNIERTHSVILQLKNMAKDLNLEKRLTPINQLMYLFINNVIHKKSEISPEVEEAMNIHNQYMRSNEVIKGYEMERERMVITGRMNRAKEEGIEIGKTEGIELGKMESCQEMIKEKYQVHDLEWLKACSLHQLDQILRLIIKEISYEELKNQILITMQE